MKKKYLIINSIKNIKISIQQILYNRKKSKIKLKLNEKYFFYLYKINFQYYEFNISKN